MPLWKFLKQAIKAMTTSQFFTSKQIEDLHKRPIPHHIAIIPDGNRRWAKLHQAHTESGHRQGANTLIRIVKAGKELGVKALSFYLFSTENWSRSNEEINFLMWLLREFLEERTPELIELDVKMQFIGDRAGLSPEVLRDIENS